MAPFVPVATTVSIEPGVVGLGWLGQTTVVEAVVLDQNGDPMAGVDLAWSSADEGVATVTDPGAITAAGDGTTLVTARAGTAQGAVAVSVSRAAASLVLGADSVVLADPGDGATLIHFVTDAGGSEISDATVVWSSSDPSVATVTQDGTVTAVATGTALVIAMAGNVADSLSVRVAPRLTLALVGEPVVDGTVASQAALSALVSDVAGPAYAGARVVWSVGAGSGSIVSSDVSTSDATGHVGAVWEYGTAAGTQRAFASLVTRGDTVVVEFLADVGAGEAIAASLIADSVLLSAVGETAFLAPGFTDAYGNAADPGAITWVSRDPGVATIAADGLLSGAGPGSTWVVAQMGGPTDSIEVGVVERGAITITFDDGWRSVWDNAWPVFQDFTFKANIGVYVDPLLGDWAAYMQEEHLDSLHAAGWSMVAHTMSHDSLTTLDALELDYELREGQEWLDARGYRGTNVFIAPYHDYGPAERVAASEYYAASRGASANMVDPDSLVAWKPDNPYELTGIEAEFLPYTTVEGRNRLRDLLQRTATEGAFLDVFFHQIPAADVDAFRATLEVIDEFRDRVLPYHELFPIWARAVY